MKHLFSQKQTFFQEKSKDFQALFLSGKSQEKITSTETGSEKAKEAMKEVKESTIKLSQEILTEQYQDILPQLTRKNFSKFKEKNPGNDLETFITHQKTGSKIILDMDGKFKIYLKEGLDTGNYIEGKNGVIRRVILEEGNDKIKLKNDRKGKFKKIKGRVNGEKIEKKDRKDEHKASKILEEIIGKANQPKEVQTLLEKMENENNFSCDLNDPICAEAQKKENAIFSADIINGLTYVKFKEVRTKDPEVSCPTEFSGEEAPYVSVNRRITNYEDLSAEVETFLLSPNCQDILNTCVVTSVIEKGGKPTIADVTEKLALNLTNYNAKYAPQITEILSGPAGQKIQAKVAEKIQEVSNAFTRTYEYTNQNPGVDAKTLYLLNLKKLGYSEYCLEKAKPEVDKILRKKVIFVPYEATVDKVLTKEEQIRKYGEAVYAQTKVDEYNLTDQEQKDVFTIFNNSKNEAEFKTRMETAEKDTFITFKTPEEKDLFVQEFCGCGFNFETCHIDLNTDLVPEQETAKNIIDNSYALESQEKSTITKYEWKTIEKPAWTDVSTPDFYSWKTEDIFIKITKGKELSQDECDSCDPVPEDCECNENEEVRKISRTTWYKNGQKIPGKPPKEILEKQTPKTPGQIIESKEVLSKNKNVYYEVDKSNLDETDKRILNKYAEFFLKNEDLDIQIDSYCSRTETEEYNQQLSERRSNEVEKFLISKGISSDRIKKYSHGEKINTETGGINTEDGVENQANRRTVIRAIVAKKEIVWEKFVDGTSIGHPTTQEVQTEWKALGYENFDEKFIGESGSLEHKEVSIKYSLSKTTKTQIQLLLKQADKNKLLQINVYGYSNEADGAARAEAIQNYIKTILPEAQISEPHLSLEDVPSPVFKIRYASFDMDNFEGTPIIQSSQSQEKYALLGENGSTAKNPLISEAKENKKVHETQKSQEKIENPYKNVDWNSLKFSDNDFEIELPAEGDTEMNDIIEKIKNDDTLSQDEQEFKELLANSSVRHFIKQLNNAGVRDQVGNSTWLGNTGELSFPLLRKIADKNYDIDLSLKKSFWGDTLLAKIGGRTKEFSTFEDLEKALDGISVNNTTEEKIPEKNLNFEKLQKGINQQKVTAKELREINQKKIQEKVQNFLKHPSTENSDKFKSLFQELKPRLKINGTPKEISNESLCGYLIDERLNKGIHFSLESFKMNEKGQITSIELKK